MKRALQYVTILLFTGNIVAQQFPNSGFETWDNVGDSDEEPTNWNSNKTGTGFASLGPQTIFRESSNIHSGSYSVRIRTSSYFGTTVNGIFTNGQVNAPSLTPSEGYNSTIRSNAAFNTPMPYYPDSIVVWANYTAGNGSDLARIATSLHGDYDQKDPYSNDNNGSSNIVANATREFTSTNGWQRVSIPFDYATYASNGASPAYLLLSMTSSNIPGAGSTNSILYVDDVELIYNPGTVAITPSADQYLLVDEAGTTLTATEAGNAASQNAAITREWKFSTTSGSGYASFSSPETGATYTPQFNATGTYYVICESTFGGETVTSDEVAIHVSETIPNIATVTPNATQNLDVNESGTTLTVAETPAAASSREWKYSTTSGSGYMSFLSDEFATSYTPVFASAGTYYVICESNFAGEIVTSNEVQINVTSTSGISEFEESDIVVYQNNEKLYLDLTNSSFKGEKVSIYTVDGRQVKEAAVTSNAVTAINIDFPNGIYLVVVQSANASSQQKIFIR